MLILSYIINLVAVAGGGSGCGGGAGGRRYCRPPGLDVLFIISDDDNETEASYVHYNLIMFGARSVLVDRNAIAPYLVDRVSHHTHTHTARQSVGYDDIILYIGNRYTVGATGGNRNSNER